jgi:hypothetical protein
MHSGTFNYIMSVSCVRLKQIRNIHICYIHAHFAALDGAIRVDLYTSVTPIIQTQQRLYYYKF